MVRIEFPPFGGQEHFSHALGLPKDLDSGTLLGGQYHFSHALGLPKDLDFGTVLGGRGATILLLGGSKHLFRPLLDLSWAPLVAPASLWAPFGTHCGASEQASRCAGIPSKVWVLSTQPGCHYTPLGGLWRPFGLLVGFLEHA